VCTVAQLCVHSVCVLNLDLKFFFFKNVLIFLYTTTLLDLEFLLNLNLVLECIHTDADCVYSCTKFSILGSSAAATEVTHKRRPRGRPVLVRGACVVMRWPARCVDPWMDPCV
jgi:hypothetical protein